MKDQNSATIADVVLPIVEISGLPPNLRYERLLGTGFLVGGSRYLLTCRHVITSVRPGNYVLALRVTNGAFETIQLDKLVTHPSQDVALYQVDISDHVTSWLLPTAEPQFQTLDCQVWGYPTDALFDSGERSLQGQVLQRPELVFMKGYIRRRISGELFGLQGDQFYELNDSAGDGCSGGPIIRVDGGRRWKVFGIYSGEMISEQTGKPFRSRGYGIRMEAVTEWLQSIDPQLLA